jgi:hypothetical protein
MVTTTRDGDPSALTWSNLEHASTPDQYLNVSVRPSEDTA